MRAERLRSLLELAENVPCRPLPRLLCRLGPRAVCTLDMELSWGILERFPAKWIPVRVKKTRQNKRLELRSDSIGTEKALTPVGMTPRSISETRGRVIPRIDDLSRFSTCETELTQVRSGVVELFNQSSVSFEH